MKYAAEIGRGAMIYISSFKTIGSGFQRLRVGGGGYTDEKTVWRSYYLTFIFEKRESRLKTAATAMSYEIGIFEDPQNSLLKI
jgi:hypothetical protein